MQDEHSAATVEGYERFFGLAEAPFTLTSSPRFLFESASYLAAFKEITYALSRGEQIVAVTGPIGTGKTTLCRMIADRRGPRAVAAVVSSPPQTVEDLFREVLDGFELLTDDARRIVEASRFGLLKVVRQFLESLVTLKAQAVLVFDEAQRLRPEILEEIRLLSNLAGDRQILQIVLVGQPELEDLLARADLGQVAQRVSRRCRLEPLQPAEVPAYVDRRLDVAQIDQQFIDRPTFTDSAMQTIVTLSRGVPRVVNIICDRSLEYAWSDRTHTVDVTAVVRAARALNIEMPPSLTTPPAPPALSAEPALVTPRLARWAGVGPSLAAPAPPAISATRPTGSLFSTPVVSEWKLPRVAVWSWIKNMRVRRSHVQIAIAAVLAVSVLLVWFVRRGSSDSSGDNNPEAAAVRGAVPPAPLDQPASRTSVPRVGANAAPSSAAAAPRASSTSDTFLIVVSSFRTRDRSARVAANIVALGFPAFVRSNSGWEQVVVGPYSSRQDAVAAQARLESAHYADTKITQASSTGTGGP